MTDEEAKQLADDIARQTAFFNTLYGTDEGRQVLLWIRNYCYERFELDGSHASAALALIELYQEIRVNCGLNEADVIDAEAETIKVGE